MTMTVVDVSEHDFQAEVIDRSRTTSRRRLLGRMVRAVPAARTLLRPRASGNVVLAKLDTPTPISQAFQIQGIPAVKAFKDGEVVDEFVGVRSPAAVEILRRAAAVGGRWMAEAGDESLRRALGSTRGAPTRRSRGCCSSAASATRPGSCWRRSALVCGRRPRGADPARGLGRHHADDAWQAIDSGDVEAGVDALRRDRRRSRSHRRPADGDRAARRAGWRTGGTRRAPAGGGAKLSRFRPAASWSSGASSNAATRTPGPGGRAGTYSLQLDSEAAHHIQVVGAVAIVRARDGREVIEPDLDRDRAPAALLAAQACTAARRVRAGSPPGARGRRCRSRMSSRATRTRRSARS